MLVFLVNRSNIKRYFDCDFSESLQLTKDELKSKFIYIDYLEGSAKNLHISMCTSLYQMLDKKIIQLLRASTIINFIGQSRAIAMYALLFRSKKMIATVHEYDMSRVYYRRNPLKSLMTKFTKHLNLSLADMLIFHSLNELEKAPNHLRSKSQIMYFGFFEMFHQKFLKFKKIPELDTTQVEISYVWIGSLSNYKGLNEIKNLLIRGQLRSLIVVGKGMDGILRDYKQVKLISRFLSDGELGWLISESRGLILPYQGVSQSGLPMISEIYGTPTYATDLDGFREYKLKYHISSLILIKDWLNLESCLVRRGVGLSSDQINSVWSKYCNDFLIASKC